MEIKAVQQGFNRVREARIQWNTARREFDRNSDKVMARLLHEAMANMMSVADVCRYSGLSPKRVRDLLRALDLNPRDGKRLLSDKAAKALHENAELLGVEPRDMDLTSPLAYLPMGQKLRSDLNYEASAPTVEEIREKVHAYPCTNCGEPVVCGNCGVSS